jgi:hypothetical protein
MPAAPVDYASRYRRLRWVSIAALALSAGSIALSGYVYWFELVCRAISP